VDHLLAHSTEKAEDAGYWRWNAKTPDWTLYSAILRERDTKGRGGALRKGRPRAVYREGLTSHVLPGPAAMAGAFLYAIPIWGALVKET